MAGLGTCGQLQVSALEAHSALTTLLDLVGFWNVISSYKPTTLQPTVLGLVWSIAYFSKSQPEKYCIHKEDCKLTLPLDRDKLNQIDNTK